MSPVDPTGEMAQECLGMRARLVSRVVSGIYDAVLRPHDLKLSQMNILVAVARMGPVAPAVVAERLCLEKSTLSRNVARLRERGWLASGPQLRITTGGRRLLGKLAPGWRKAQARARQALGARGGEALLRMARHAAESAHA